MAQDPSYATLNYEAVGGALWVVGGELDIYGTLVVKTGGKIVPNSGVAPAAPANVVTTASALTSYGYTEAQADSIPVAINAIIAILTAAGLTA